MPGTGLLQALLFYDIREHSATGITFRSYLGYILKIWGHGLRS